MSILGIACIFNSNFADGPSGGSKKEIEITILHIKWIEGDQQRERADVKELRVSFSKFGKKGE